MVREKRPHLVFLMETKMTQRKAEVVQIKLGFENYFLVDCIGKSGGLMLLWKNSIMVEIQNFSRRQINAVVQCSSDAPSWKLTGFYGHPDVAKRGESWELLHFLAKLPLEPWLCLGNFNEITTASEKSSKSSRLRAQMGSFQNALTDCRLMDMGYIGPKFTWCNGRQGSEFTKERLDRAVSNGEWGALFNVVEV